MIGRNRYGMLMLSTVLLSGSVFARIDMTPLTVTMPLSWSGGDLLASTDFCVLSTFEPNPGGTTPSAYNMQGFAPFTLTSGANTIPYSLSWKDLFVAGSSAVPLTAGVATTVGFTGAISACPTGNNGRLNLSIPQAVLAGVPPGVYTGALLLEASTVDSKGRKIKQSTVNLTLTLPWAIRISQLNDINLGIFSGITALTGSDSLCVYRNSNAPYGVRVSGQGTAGAFVVASGGNQIPLQVTWNDGTGAAVLSPGTLLSNRGNVYTAGVDCAAGTANNATLGVTATAAGMSAANPGQYSGVLTITVETQ